MPIDLTHELSYEYINICITEFEEAALASDTRAGLLAVSHGSTYGADVLLDAQDRTLGRVSDTRKRLSRKPASETDVGGEGAGGGVGGATQDGTEQEGIFQQVENSKVNKEGLPLVSADVDMNTLFGKGGDSAFANYLEDCLGCSLRLKFDWQLQPLNLLGPINAFLDSLNAALDRILGRLDPFRILADICNALNHLKTFCPQDLILVLMSLKLLLKKYLLQMASLKLDWTVLLGPLLNALVSALTDLLDNLFALLMAPLNCALSAMVAANDLIKATQSFAASLVEAAGTVDVTASTHYKDVSWTDVDPEKKADPLKYFNDTAEKGIASGGIGYDPGKLQVKNIFVPSNEKPPPVADDAIRIPAGFTLTSNTNMSTAIQDPTFVNSTALEKLIIPVQEAIAFLRETYEKFVGSLNSLGSLVGGSLGLSLDNLGILLYITDLISLVMLIIELLKSNLNVKDWCSFLQENPAVLEAAIRSNGRFGNPNIERTGEGIDTELLIKQGPNIVGTVKTCVSERTTIDNDIIGQWVRELEAQGAI